MRLNFMNAVCKKINTEGHSRVHAGDGFQG